MKMFGFSRRRMKLGRLKVQLSDSTQGTNSPIRHVKRSSKSDGEAGVRTSSNTDELNCQCSSTGVELNNSTSGSSDSWTVFSASGDKPSPRFNHAATVIGDKMVVVGGESGQGLLEDVQVLNFEKFTWTTATSKLYLSPASLPLKIPACKGHTMVTWGKKALLIGGKTNPASDRISVWAFDTETESWSLIEAKGNVPVARSGHSVIRAGSVLILFGGEDTKGRKLNDLHMFDLKSLMWLPLHCTGTGPSPRTNHVAALYEDRILLIFGGASKSRTLNDLYSLDFETMIWTRIKIRGFHPSPRAGCRGVLCGSKWYIVGGGSKKKLDEVTKYIPDPPGMSISCNSLGHADTLVFDVLKLEWSVAIASSPTSITSSKGFSLVLVHHKEKVFVVAFGGWKKEASNQIEVLVMERNEQLMGRQTMPNKGSGPALYENNSSKSGFADQPGARPCSVDSVARQNIASVLELHGSGRRSISVSSLADPNPISNSFHKHLHNEEENKSAPSKNIFEDEHYKEADHCSVSKSASLQAMEQRIKASDTGIHTNNPGVVLNKEELSSVFDPRAHQKQVNAELLSDKNDIVVLEANEKKVGLYQLYETKIAALTRKNGMLEEQLTTAMTNKETAENDLSSVIKSKQEIEKKLTDTVKEMELLKEKLSSIEVAQEEANSLSNIVHSDNVRLEHDVAFLKAVLDDTQKELHSTRGVLAGERARAFQLQVEVFHLKQRLQSMENRAPTPRKPFHL